MSQALNEILNKYAALQGWWFKKRLAQERI